MEAVGQLTGGIAHDFNNLLMVIGGSVELLRKRVPAEPGLTRLLDAASQSVARGGSLNQQLLAFARRQDLREESFCINANADALVHLAERAASEAISIRTDLAPDLWHCSTDVHQLETAVLNLSINARDAMPQGGQLLLKTQNRTIDAETAAFAEVEPGDFVAVSVTDTGVGMSSDVVARVFEPFFTTKAVGSGTGLGLSQVYGFAKQSGGFVAIDSTVGQGTTVTINLKRADPPSSSLAEKPSAKGPMHGDASILVIEDDHSVREMACSMLRSLGYRIVEAESGKAGLAQLGHSHFDLVFTDVILPEGISGIDVAEAVKASWPQTPVLLTSGYTADHLKLRSDSTLQVVTKPYNLATLSEAVRAALGGHVTLRH